GTSEELAQHLQPSHANARPPLAVAHNAASATRERSEPGDHALVTELRRPAADAHLDDPAPAVENQYAQHAQHAVERALHNQPTYRIAETDMQEPVRALVDEM